MRRSAFDETWIQRGAPKGELIDRGDMQSLADVGLATFKDFPSSQQADGFSIDQVLERLAQDAGDKSPHAAESLSPTGRTRPVWVRRTQFTTTRMEDRGMRRMVRGIATLGLVLVAGHLLAQQVFVYP